MSAGRILVPGGRLFVPAGGGGQANQRTGGAPCCQTAPPCPYCTTDAQHPLPAQLTCIISGAYETSDVPCAYPSHCWASIFTSSPNGVFTLNAYSACTWTGHWYDDHCLQYFGPPPPTNCCQRPPTADVVHNYYLTVYRSSAWTVWLGFAPAQMTRRIAALTAPSPYCCMMPTSAVNMTGGLSLCGGVYTQGTCQLVYGGPCTP